MYKENVHKADLGNGYYMNPILNGDYPDPAVFRDGDDYYLCVSTAVYLPGLTIFHSKDLVNWQILCSPLKNLVGSKNAVWAPDILKYRDKYYIYFCSGGTNYVMWSDKIDEGWSEPIDLKVGRIDPGHVVDENGKRFLLLSGNHIAELSDDGLSVVSEPRQLFKAPPLPEEWETEGEYPEAPNIFKRNCYYYLTYADGGTAGPATSHMIMSARAGSLNGPWEMSPYNPVVHTYSRSEKWISKGHGHFVEDTEGNWWVIYHAYENGYESHGRKLLLSPVEFTEDGWFKVIKKADAACLKPSGKALEPQLSLSDTFGNAGLNPKWQVFGECLPDKYTQLSDELIVTANGTKVGDCNPLTFITGDHSYEISVKLTPDDVRAKAGLILQYNQNIFNGIAIEEGRPVLYRLGRALWRGDKLDATEFWLKMVNNDQYLSCYYSIDGASFTKVSQVINLIPQNNNAYGGFLSLRPGLFAFGEGTVHFSNLCYKGLK